MNYITKTDTGVVRAENQDRVAVFKNENVTFGILCDGMGGHAGGSYAASITIDSFEKEFNKNFPNNSKNYNKWFLKAVSRAKKEMESFANDDQNLLDMGTTVTCVVIVNEDAYIFNIGDSRTYAYNGLLHQITKDHNLRNHYIEKFGYSDEKAATLMGAAALTSALGPRKKSKIDSFITPIDKDLKYFILTSDGVHDYISKPNFEKIISLDISLEEKADRLIISAIKGKSSDNLTVAIVEVD